jgi:hypothetical protein
MWKSNRGKAKDDSWPSISTRTFLVSGMFPLKQHLNTGTTVTCNEAAGHIKNLMVIILLSS